MSQMIYSLEDVKALYGKPLLELVFDAASIHRKHHNPCEVQLCTLLSIKTGGCPEDCGYCPQSIHHNADLERERLLAVDEVLEKAQLAKKNGSTRFCMGAGWRQVPDGRAFERVLEMIREVNKLDLEVCCTLGMVNEKQAVKLAEAGLTAYNHNLDTSEKNYKNIITTRTYQDRFNTINNISKAGISVCCGGILGLGETEEDRVMLLHTLASLDPQPESVPINALVPVPGTPIGDKAKPLDIFEWIRCIAVARIIMPKAMVRLSAGRLSISKEAQALAFLAGANSIFTGEKLLTTPNPKMNFDMNLFQQLDLQARPAHKIPSELSTAV